MNYFPTDPKKIKAMISRYKRKLAKEKSQFDYISDGSGLRYLIGPLYMILGDNQTALESFHWFTREFPDDISEPAHHLCWALCLRRAGQTQASENKLMQTAFQNLYLIPHLIGEDIDRLDISHLGNWQEKEYLEDIPEEFWDLWSEADIAWAREYWRRDATTEAVNEYIDLRHQLLSAPGGSGKRMDVLDKMRAIEDKYMP